MDNSRLFQILNSGTLLEIWPFELDHRPEVTDDKCSFWIEPFTFSCRWEEDRNLLMTVSVHGLDLNFRYVEEIFTVRDVQVAMLSAASELKLAIRDELTEDLLAEIEDEEETAVAQRSLGIPKDKPRSLEKFLEKEPSELLRYTSFSSYERRINLLVTSLMRVLEDGEELLSELESSGARWIIKDSVRGTSRLNFFSWPLWV